MIQRLKGEDEKSINKNKRKDIDGKIYDKVNIKKDNVIRTHNLNETYKNILNTYEESPDKHINNNIYEECVEKNIKDLHVNDYCYCYNYDNIRNKNILDNLNINHLAYILSTLCKLNIHDDYIYNKCVINIRKKIFKININLI
ncbi:hypothetical protein PFFVO_01325 [Plasmodium falciparum Vietnam Oak-Knoll (FVO)]|uniref:Uncharacterized protein n=1 Tax=Plasmodium falciparum Vietnam Oak-Knoll (FVO) TaxID=1036723 RepID=A0A024VCC3_PLAFA|nr:hypothetical protein PFFVO_01325 [Plasmodium falciparum Vietnam Oak-Knoll (FVO)]